MTTQAERMGRVEVEVIALKESIDAHKKETAKQFSDMGDKLDQLIELRNKGAGVFWFVSSLTGLGIVSGGVQLFHYMFGGK